NESISGVFGLGPSLLTLDSAKSFVDNAASQWSQPLMGIYFGPNPGQPNEDTAAPGGGLTIGGTNSQYYKGDIEYKDAYGNGDQESWLLPLTAITVQGKSISIPSFSVLSTVIGKLYGNANVDVSFAFGGSSWAISPRDIAVSDIAAPGITSSQTCLGAIYSLGNGTTNYLLGDTFLRNVYTVLRVNSPYSFSVGFAQLASECDMLVL
ncbi:aspartic peptidase domain-containing protein, partial [Hygrophoropsis aurantiaca]